MTLLEAIKLSEELEANVEAGEPEDLRYSAVYTRHALDNLAKFRESARALMEALQEVGCEQLCETKGYHGKCGNCLLKQDTIAKVEKIWEGE